MNGSLLYTYVATKPKIWRFHVDFVKYGKEMHLSFLKQSTFVALSLL